MPAPFRVNPALGPGAYKTYAISAPVSTHRRPASCAEAECEQHLHGWTTPVEDPETEAFLRQVCGGHVDGIRRHFIEQREETTGRLLFIFEPGQTCFRASQHTVPLERPELYLVRGGDWRGNPNGIRTHVHSGPDAWVNDFGEHQDRLRRTLEGG
jgi:hypothetical protein